MKFFPSYFDEIYNRETLAKEWTIAHDLCQLCARCYLGGGSSYAGKNIQRFQNQESGKY